MKTRESVAGDRPARQSKAILTDAHLWVPAIVLALGLLLLVYFR